MNLIQHWFVHRLFDQPQTIVVNTPVVIQEAPTVVECTDNDLCVAYGFKNYYECEDENVFKLYADEKTGAEYAEFSLDNMVYVRMYRGNKIYISTDNREWKPFEYTGKLYFRDGRYLSVNEKIWEIYNDLTRQENYVTM